MPPSFFPISDLFSVDRAIAADIATLVAFLGQQPCAVYPNEFERREEIVVTSANGRAARTEAVYTRLSPPAGQSDKMSPWPTSILIRCALPPRSSDPASLALAAIHAWTDSSVSEPIVR